MIEAVYSIGKIQNKKQDKKRSFLDNYIEDIGKKYKNVFKIVIDVTDKKHPQYIGIGYEEFDSSKKMKYFYKKGSSNGPDKTPTSKITTVDKVINNKLRTFFEKFLKSKKSILSNEEKEFIESLDKLIKEKISLIKEDLLFEVKKQNLLKNSKNELKEPSIITLIFREETKDYYIGDMQIFKETFAKDEKSSYENFYKKSNKISKAENKYCYICKNKAEEVWGFVNTYNFYTVDKSSFVIGGFDQSKSWKNYPVCSECAKILEIGKKYVEDNLKYKFCGFEYYIIPQLVVNDGDQLLSKILDRQKKYDNFSLKEDRSSRIEQVEEKILRELSKENNNINFNFLFFKKSNNEFKILLYMQEISPTRLKYLIEAKDKVDDKEREYDIFQEIVLKKDKTINFNFSFSFIRDFFPNNKFDGKFDKYFLSIINNIFINKKISMDFLVDRFMEKIRSAFLEDKWIDVLLLKSYKILIYLDEINILDRRKEFMKNYANDFENFFKENQMLDNETKKAIFLEGVLAKKLLNIQYQERNSTPFKARLNGLKIDERIAKRLLPEIINKLEEYNKNYYSKLEEAIAEYMLKADFKSYSVGELSYYFTLGMVLAKYFSFEKENNN